MNTRRSRKRPKINYRMKTGSHFSFNFQLERKNIVKSRFLVIIRNETENKPVSRLMNVFLLNDYSPIFYTIHEKTSHRRILLVIYEAAFPKIKELRIIEVSDSKLQENHFEKDGARRMKETKVHEARQVFHSKGSKSQLESRFDIVSKCKTEKWTTKCPREEGRKEKGARVRWRESWVKRTITHFMLLE